MTGWAIRMPDGQWLDVPIGFQISFELNNAIFAGSSTSVLPGSYSFPATLSNSPANAKALGYPSRVTVPNIPATYKGVWIYAAGMPAFFGDLNLQNANPRDITINLDISPLAELKAKKLTDFDLGGTRTLGSTDSARRSHMYDTVNEPDSHDYVFTPVSAPFYFETNPDHLALTETFWQNRYDASPSFPLAGGAITPFPKLRYILQQMTVGLSGGWLFVNDVQPTTDIEMQRLYLYSNLSLADEEGNYPDDFDLQNHVPDVLATELLKYICETFCAGVFTNIFSRTVTLKPLKEVLSAPVKYDWTEYAIEGAQMDYVDRDPIERFCHPQVDFNWKRLTNPPPSYSDELTEIDHYDRIDDVTAAITAGTIASEQYVYVTTEEAIYEVYYTGTEYLPRFAEHRRLCKFFAFEPELETKLQPMLTGRVLVAAPSLYLYLPEWRQNGSYLYEDPDSSQVELVENDAPLAIFFYRGIQTTGTGASRPVAGVGTWSHDGTGTAEIVTDGTVEASASKSLLWLESNGLYEVWWKRWNEITRTGKRITQALRLPVAQLTAFNFEDKIRILNMDYFVVSLNVQRLDPEGFFIVEAELFSVI